MAIVVKESFCVDWYEEILLGPVVAVAGHVD